MKLLHDHKKLKLTKFWLHVAWLKIDFIIEIGYLYFWRGFLQICLLHGDTCKWHSFKWKFFCVFCFFISLLYEFIVTLSICYSARFGRGQSRSLAAHVFKQHGKYQSQRCLCKAWTGNQKHHRALSHCRRYRVLGGETEELIQICQTVKNVLTLYFYLNDLSNFSNWYTRETTLNSGQKTVFTATLKKNLLWCDADVVNTSREEDIACSEVIISV